MRDLALSQIQLSGKRGNVQMLAPAIITLVMAAAMLVLGMIILESVNDITYKTYTPAAIVNESSIIAVKESGFNTTVYLYKDAVCKLNKCVNATDGILIPAANLTATNCHIRYSGALASGPNNSIWKCSYNYSYSAKTDISDASNKSLVGLGTFADFWEIIVLAIVITIVVGMLLVVFAGRRAK
jgi:hypothetical protein